jgi:hypothetical protein
VNSLSETKYKLLDFHGQLCCFTKESWFLKVSSTLLLFPVQAVITTVWINGQLCSIAQFYIGLYSHSGMEPHNIKNIAQLSEQLAILQTQAQNISCLLQSLYHLYT